MNLVIDVGNTQVKLAIYSKGRLIKKVTDAQKNISARASELILSYPSISAGIISSVGKVNKQQLQRLKKIVPLHILSSRTVLPFKNKYKTPLTLGVDRIALVSASAEKYPDSNVLIIDAGTCVTYDFVNSKNEYLGGAISPGIRTRYKSLNNLTANLPLLETKPPRSIIGNTTASSIHSGVIFGILKELDGVIEEYKNDHQDLTVILTGGDAKFLSKRLKSSIFANSNFLLEGLNYILEFNIK
ncbi:MAG: type III pantothenate kinase [Bacteroidia bacterium]|nr:type III pantothenate kinase [Bacteroidia bacterium]NND26584.1 type III pantothenate kinase [Flavobacteriaceae bacterium]MBT8277761.1 type III pantothenate kinase [Bacteroidia bacterium]NNK61444.1 type III pantothenate kinase [Flavobacteriaceae bacterium]NNL33168.1 type III pantothenate kinase [Flavobacteriaceae bacterium]